MAGHEFDDPEEHPDFEHVGDVHAVAIEDDWVDLEDNDFMLFHVGRIGDVYFEIDVERNTGWLKLGADDGSSPSATITS